MHSNHHRPIRLVNFSVCIGGRGVSDIAPRREGKSPIMDVIGKKGAGDYKN